jgi:hypothetical protein
MKAPNYTAEATARIIEDYQAGVSVEQIASRNRKERAKRSLKTGSGRRLCGNPESQGSEE